jgi:Flp pilus assembly protein TadD
MMTNEVTASERLQRALAYKNEGCYPEALTELEALVALFPAEAEAHHQLGLVLGFTGDFDASVEALRQAVVLEPSNMLLHNDLALTYTMLGMFDEAKQEFACVLQHDRDNQVALRNMTYLH